MAEQSQIVPELKALIGKKQTFSSPEEVGGATIRRFAVAIGDPNPLYLDDEYAKKTCYGGVIAPSTLIFELNHNIEEELLEEDGGQAHKFYMLPSFKPVFFRGGNEYEFYQPVRPTDKVTVEQEISKIYEKAVKTGVLTFVVVKLTYTNQRDELLAINWETWIFPPTSKIS